MFPEVQDQAMRLAARLKAYDWYCQRQVLPDPIPLDGRLDPQAERLHGLAWAWAGQHWVGFLPEVEDIRFIGKLIYRVGRDMARPKGRHGRRNRRR